MQDSVHFIFLLNNNFHQHIIKSKPILFQQPLIKRMKTSKWTEQNVARQGFKTIFHHSSTKCLKKKGQGKWTAKSRKGRLLHISLSIQIQSIDNKSNDAICAGGIALQLQDQMVYLDHYNIEAPEII